MEADKSAEQALRIFKLEIIVSRLHALGIANTETIMNLVSSLVEDPDLPTHLRPTSLEAFKTLRKQMEILRELTEMTESNGEE